MRRRVVRLARVVCRVVVVRAVSRGDKLEGSTVMVAVVHVVVKEIGKVREGS